MTIHSRMEIASNELDVVQKLLGLFCLAFEDESTTFFHSPWPNRVWNEVYYADAAESVKREVVSHFDVFAVGRCHTRFEMAVSECVGANGSTTTARINVKLVAPNTFFCINRTFQTKRSAKKKGRRKRGIY